MLGIADGTLDELTAYQLDTAAADLRNAGLVVKHAGHFRNFLVDPRRGSVCALGAIQLATYRRLAQISASREFVTLTCDNSDARRGGNAVMVFADTLPGDLCDACSDPFGYRGEEESQVTHYNDVHCASGEMLITMLNNAADRALTRAAARRSLVHGRLLVGV